MKKHFMFIYQSGWRQIVTPDGHVVDLTSCDDGYYVTVDDDAGQVVAELNEFAGHPVVEVHCDDASITVGNVFVNAKLVDRRQRCGSSSSILINTRSTTGNYCEPIVKDGLVAKFHNSIRLFYNC